MNLAKISLVWIHEGVFRYYCYYKYTLLHDLLYYTIVYYTILYATIFHYPVLHCIVLSLASFDSLDEVRNCSLGGLTDLNQRVEWVRQRIADYLNSLIDLGVAGFRIDAAKHMWPEDLSNIFSRVNAVFLYLPIIGSVSVIYLYLPIFSKVSDLYLYLQISD